MGLSDKERARVVAPSREELASVGPSVERLVLLMRWLRANDGCAWDREQTVESLRRYLVEETHELLDAIDDKDMNAHLEELGDVLFQVVFQSRIREEEGHFGFADVVNGIADKLVRRHPHVFADAEPGSVDWESLKSAEKPGRGLLDGVPRSAPALSVALSMGEKTAQVGFDFPSVSAALEKADEERAELDEALRGGESSEIQHEFGDLLFAVANAARLQGLDPEEALRLGNARFRTRFGHLEKAAAATGRGVGDHSLDELERLWQAAKRALGDIR